MPHLAVAQIVVVLYIGKQNAAQLLQVVTAGLVVEGLLAVSAHHILVNPASPLSPLGVPAA